MILRRFSTFLGAGAVVATMLLLARQHTLNELRASNEALRQQLATQDGAAQVPVRASDTGSTNHVPPLTPEERVELLRLRGQIGPLRRELDAFLNSHSNDAGAVRPNLLP